LKLIEENTALQAAKSSAESDLAHMKMMLEVLQKELKSRDDERENVDRELDECRSLLESEKTANIYLSEENSRMQNGL
jgi:hypothetical protein